MVNVVMPSVFMLSVNTLSVILLIFIMWNVIMLSGCYA
jgi:hypothetical protein